MTFDLDARLIIEKDLQERLSEIFVEIFLLNIYFNIFRVFLNKLESKDRHIF